MKREHGFLFTVMRRDALFLIYFLKSVIPGLDPPPPPFTPLFSVVVIVVEGVRDWDDHYLNKFLSRANNTQQLKASVLKQIR